MRFAVSFIVGMFVLATEVVIFVQHLGGVHKVLEFLTALLMMPMVGFVIAGGGITIAFFSTVAAVALVYWILGFFFAGDRDE